MGNNALKPFLTGIADAIRAKEGGSGEVGPVNITWDGDTTGLTNVNFTDGVNLYKVSDLVFTDDEIRAGTITVNANGEPQTIAISELWDGLVESGYLGADFVSVAPYVFFVRKDGLELEPMVFPKAGVYFMNLGYAFTSGFSTTAALSGGGPIPAPTFAQRILDLPTGGEQATPVIEVSNGGLITATAGDKSATKQLSTQSGKTITPGATEQIAVAAGKYVTGDIIVAAVQAGGYDDPYPVFNMNVDVPKVSMAVTAERYYSHALYNGVRLPRIPNSALASYPYAWIRKNTTSGNYDLILTAVPGYYDPTAGDNPGMVYGLGAASATAAQYLVSIENAASATEWSYNQTTTTWFGLDSNRVIFWSNHDIPNGSADATDIYFEGTDPVPVD